VEEIMWRDHRLVFNVSDEARCVFPTGFDIYENALPLEKELFEGIDRLLWYPSTAVINVVDREYGDSYGVAHPDATIHKVFVYVFTATTDCTIVHACGDVETHIPLFIPLYVCVADYKRSRLLLVVVLK
jgi:hypothetical protein